MKNLLLVTFTTSAVLSLPVMAKNSTDSLFGDVAFLNDKEEAKVIDLATSDKNETTLSANYKLNNGIIIGAETIYDWNSDTSGIKETAIGAAYRYNFTDNFYVMPQVSYIFRDRSSDFTLSTKAFPVNPDLPSTSWVDPKYNVGDAWRVGLQSGYHFNNGVFISAKYNYEKSKDTFNLDAFQVEEFSAHSTIGFDKTVPNHELGLTLGYQFSDVAVVSASWTQNKFSDVNGMVDDGYPPISPMTEPASFKVNPQITK